MIRALTRGLALACLLAVAACTGGNPALAQVEAAGVPIRELWSDVAVPILVTLASGIITAAISIAAAYFARLTGIQIEAGQREALHSAAMTGVNLALSRLEAQVGGMTLTTKSRVVDDALGWVVTTGAPAAVKTLGLDAVDVRKLVESKLGALTNAVATVAVTTGARSADRA